MSEPRRLGALGKSLLVLGVLVAVGLVLATGIVAARESQRCARTLEVINVVARELRLPDLQPPPSAGHYADDDAGQCALLNGLREQCDRRKNRPNIRSIMDLMERSSTGRVVDAWDHPLLYRCPGPVHRHGWDLYSIGPNGVDDEGQGDDILVGEDVAPEASTR